MCEPMQLSSECHKTRASYRRYPIVSWIGDDMEQFLDIKHLLDGVHAVDLEDRLGDVDRLS